ncbi:MAG: CRISPR-associated protein Csn1, partial [Alistipes sp.]
GIPIKKVRYYTPLVTRPLHIRMQRDLSVHDYKHQYHVVNGNNYMMAIYEKPDAKGKLKREFELINNLTAASNCKQSTDKISFPDLVPIQKNEMPLKFLLKTGTMVIFWEHTPDEIWELDKQEISKRLYKVTGMSTLIVQNKYSYGTVDLRHHQEARPAKDLQAKNGLFQAGEVYRPLIHISHTQLNVLVQGYDFDLTILGEVRPITH